MRSWLARCGIFVLMFVIRLSASARGATYSWTLPANQAGDWSVASNWTGALPTSSDSAYIANGGKATITLPGATCSQLFLGGQGGSGSIQMTGGLLKSSSQCLGNGDYGSFAQSGGTNQIGSSLYVGYQSIGSYSLNGNASLSASNSYVGSSLGQGTFNQSGGTHTVTSLYVNNGAYNLGGNSTLSASNTSVGGFGQGSFNQSGGTHSVTNLSLDNGTYNLSGNAQLSSSNASIGAVYYYDGGPGTFNQTGGTHTVANQINVGSAGIGTYSISGSGVLIANSLLVGSTYAPGSFTQFASAKVVANSVYTAGGTYSLSDNALLSAGSINVGGNFVQSGGTTIVSAALALGYGFDESVNADMYGTYSLSGNGLLSSKTVFVGGGVHGGYLGDFAQTGGTNLVAGSLYVGDSPRLDPSDSRYSLAGNSLLSTSNTYVTGTFTQSGGTNIVKQSLYVGFGYSGPPNGYYAIGGNSLLSVTNVYIGAAPSGGASGTMTQSGGTVSIRYLRLGDSSYGIYNLDGGELALLNLEVHSTSAAFYFNGGTLQAGGAYPSYGRLVLGAAEGNATIDTAGYTVLLTSISGPGNLIKAGAGTLSLFGTNDYSGGTTVADGALVVTQSTAIEDGSDLTIGNSVAFPAPIVPGEAMPDSQPTTPVPEPGTLALIPATAVALVCYSAGRRRRRLLQDCFRR